MIIHEQRGVIALKPQLEVQGCMSNKPTSSRPGQQNVRRRTPHVAVRCTGFKERYKSTTALAWENKTKV